jgi:hypothetical protein
MTDLSRDRLPRLGMGRHDQWVERCEATFQRRGDRSVAEAIVERWGARDPQRSDRGCGRSDEQYEQQRTDGRSERNEPSPA